jgi:hypothetical protein
MCAMVKLNSRQMYVPGGFTFAIPEIKFTAPKGASFDIIVQAIIAARKANPTLLARHGWATDYNTVANELDEWNAQVCLSNGWTSFVTGSGGGASVPFPQHLPQAHPSPSLRKVVAAAKPLVKWITSADEAVPQEQSNKRAAVCVACPLNEKGDWKRFFTVPASEAIQAALSVRMGMKLSTDYDDKLSVCTACSCPLKLKVHMKLAEIVKDLDQGSRDNLDKDCWIRQEELGK